MKRVLLVCLVLGLAFAGLNTAQGQVEFITNGGFEMGVVDPLNPVGPDKGAQTAEPYTWWGGGGHQAPYDQGRNPNPSVDGNNGSANSWCNFGNPTYVNVASHHTWLFEPFTNMWLSPGATFRFQSQVYVPSQVYNHDTATWEDNECTPNVTPRHGITLSSSASDPPGQETYIQPLNRNYYDDPYSEPPVGPITNAVSPDVVALDTWQSFDFEWTFAGPLPQKVNYPAFRMFGGDGRYVGRNGNGVGPPGDPSGPALDVHNPGAYFDNLSITSDDYRDDLMGYVKDPGGNPIAGAEVTLTHPWSDQFDVVTTEADGSYQMPTWAPLGYQVSVDATHAGYPLGSTGAQVLDVTSGAGVIPDITLVPEPSTVMMLVAGLMGLMVYWRRK